MVLSTLFSTNGIDPRFFGNATACEIPDYGIAFDAELSFLAPLDIPLSTLRFGKEKKEHGFSLMVA